MKKAFSIIALLIAMVFVLTACSTPPTPELTERWNAEKVTYNISKVSKNNVIDEENEIPQYDKVPGAQIEPSAVEGTLTYDVSKDGANWKIVITMDVTQTYATSQLPSDWESTLTQSKVPFVKSGNDVKISSAMESQSVFGSIYSDKKPVSSKKAVFGAVLYYDEETQPALEVNKFETATTYDGSNAKSTFKDYTGKVDNRQDSITVDCGDDFFFDNETFLLAIRSIDMEMLNDASSMDINFYNSVDQKMQTATIIIAADDYKLDEKKDDTYYRVGVKLDSTSGYAYYMYFEQSAKIAHPGAGVGNTIYQQKLVEFNQDYMHFEIA